MSIFKYLFDNEWSQRADIEELKMRARRQHWASINGSNKTESEIYSLEVQVRQLQEQVGSLQLVTRGLVSMLKEQKNWDEKKFQRTLLEIDIEDGVQDGQVTRKIDRPASSE